MDVHIRQIGGFAGVLDLGAVDPARLPRKLEEVVSALRPPLQGVGPGADLPRYEVTIRDGARTRRVEASDPQDPALQALLAAARGPG